MDRVQKGSGAMTTKSMTLTVSLCLATWGAQAATLGLSVSKIGTGTGTVASADRTISCGSKCAATYGSGATVTLTATPATGSSFAGWTGAVTGAGTTVTVKISSATNVAAIFSAGSTATPAYNMALTLSDGAQGTTLAFDGLAMIAGNLQAQSFFPPGKVSDYFGFQYLRDNDPDNMGHDTSFLTRVANNVIYILTDAQFAQLKALAIAQNSQVAQYGYQRYPLMQAFRRAMDRTIPSGSSGLSQNAVRLASQVLYALDGQVSFDRAVVYASIINSFTTAQKAYLASMKGKGFNSWPNISDSQVSTRMSGLPNTFNSAQYVMGYASDIYSWYNGSLDADVYFCPERHGTYYGGFYIKDAPAVGVDGYNISEQLTATAGAALIDPSQGYVTSAQAALIAGLVDTQRNNLYASATANIVSTRTSIAQQLRSLLTSTASPATVKSQVLQLSAVYGDLDGANNYAYAATFANVNNTSTPSQITKMVALRKALLSGIYTDGMAFDFSTCSTYFLYSDAITNTGVLAPYISNTNYLFFNP
jgi:hypothetical protein